MSPMTTLVSMATPDRYGRSAAIALIGGTVAGLLTMIFHPTGREVIQSAAGSGGHSLAIGVHLMAMLGLAAQTSGCMELARRLRRKDLAVGGCVCLLLAAMSGIVAAAASGLMAPRLLEGYGTADDVRQQAMLDGLRITGAINQGFAELFVLFSCSAIVVWSAAMILDRGGWGRLGWYGAVAGLGLLAGRLAGVLALDIHGFGLVVLVQGIWMSWAGVWLWRGRGRS